MRASVFLVLPLLGLGCKAPTHEIQAVEYRPGASPTVVAAKCDGMYTLHAIEDATRSDVEVEVAKGASVGFRRAPDGNLIAIAGERTLTIPDGRYLWGCVPKSDAQWERFVSGSRNAFDVVTESVYDFFLSPFTVFNALTGG